MKRLLVLLAFLLPNLLVAADDAKETAAKKEREKLAGMWKIVSAEHEGKADAAAKGALMTYRADGKFVVKFADGKAGKGDYKLDPTTKPKTIDTTMDYGPNKGKVHEGIYVLQGDGLKICQSDPGKPRPKEFTAKEGTGQTLLILAREKPQAAQAPKAPAPPPSPVVVFADKSLEAAIRHVLQHTSGDLTEAVVANVYFLEANGAQISNLQGIDKCKNLALLKLTKNQISNLAPLKELTNLQSLDLAENKVADLAPLAGLTKLQYLELSHNQVRDLGPLHGLTSLASLYLTGNQIHDLAPLANLSKLASLSLGHNQIQDLSVFTKITRLNTLELKDNQITDISPLAKQTELSLLMLERNRITDLLPLVHAAKADYDGPKRFAPYLRLYVAGNPLSDAARTSQLAALRGYGVRVED